LEKATESHSTVIGIPVEPPPATNWQYDVILVLFLIKAGGLKGRVYFHGGLFDNREVGGDVGSEGVYSGGEQEVAHNILLDCYDGEHI
jgi:hypothetical protein